VARIELAPQVGDDAQRILAHLAAHEAQGLPERMAGIVVAIDVLVHNPCIGRLVEDGMRELVIGRDERGCVALYRYVDALDLVLVLAFGGQREAGYSST
jgi:plasmid stabilization system protein ParE